MGNLIHWVFAVTGVIFIAELVVGRHRGIYSRNDWFVNTICILFGLLLRPLSAAAIASVLAALLPQWKGALAGAPFLPSLIAIVLLGEFANYWVHRLSHQFKGARHMDWLWRMHRTHHTGKYVNVLLNFRTSLFWTLVGGLSWVLALSLYLGLALPAGFAVTLFMLWGIITHADFRWDDAIRAHPRVGTAFRAMEHVLISPGVHHSHHGYGRDGGNFRNYGIMLAIYDWMFGTLYIPKGRPFRYGIPGESPHWADDAFAPMKPAEWTHGLRNGSRSHMQAEGAIDRQD
ncbi:sterol desaturase/sphingolipid hydroxylase (fatty acid hydroxylase superfamily) [Sphingobium wenxiniae]|nr:MULTISPECIES: sterol desaturase family protein [Sphingobium]MBB6193734.1 sterol desaturase/sphingolipid hydroxylase (fatty acid hydroxylase superfamily) [Sphingobium wenxiniae]TWH96719.1 sterol desaturase/sphingolipid hydroxylase (fatty acid hydroxylase superfamily) [Sphingobium wenxiniae]WRD75300.1 sterol desaturase family protein [Sphingobium baderi]